MVVGLLVCGFTSALIPLASGATLLSLLLLVAAQLGDGFYVVYEINQVSLRQTIAEERMLGRVNATMRFLEPGRDPAGRAGRRPAGRAVGRASDPVHRRGGNPAGESGGLLLRLRKYRHQ